MDRVCSCHSSPASPPSPLFVQSIPENVLGLLLFFFSTLSACLSIYVSPLLIFSVTLTVSLGSVNTVWESLWHYVHSISELKKHQQTLIPRQETPLQHKATSQSPAVKNGSAGICFSSSEFHSVLLQRLPLRN